MGFGQEVHEGVGYGWEYGFGSVGAQGVLFLFFPHTEIQIAAALKIPNRFIFIFFTKWKKNHTSLSNFIG